MLEVFFTFQSIVFLQVPQRLGEMPIMTGSAIREIFSRITNRNVKRFIARLELFDQSEKIVFVVHQYKCSNQRG